jgi:mRNA interferase HicA
VHRTFRNLPFHAIPFREHNPLILGNLKNGRLCPILGVKSTAFMRRVRRYARRHDPVFHYDARKGKGSHGRLFLGDRLTTVKHGTISPGLARKMLKDLGIDPKEF